MLKTLLLSRAVKLAATCVCPVAGAGVVTMAVPPVRHAVHHFTEPREIALPKTRVRPVASPCPPAGAPVIASPAVLGAPPVIAPDAPAVVTPADLAAVAAPGAPGTLLPVTPITLTSGDLGPPVLGGSSPPGIIPSVPEARTWLQLVIGFGMVGGTTRMAQAKFRAPQSSEPNTRV